MLLNVEKPTYTTALEPAHTRLKACEAMPSVRSADLPFPKMYKVELSIATAMLERRIVHDIWGSYLPALEHLELWLDESEVTANDFAPLLSGKLFPRLSCAAPIGKSGGELSQLFS